MSVSIWPELADKISCYVNPMSYFVDNIMTSIMYEYKTYNLITEK